MKLSEIEEVGYLLTAYDEDRHALYTADQMQEYAKECVREAYKEITQSSYVSDGRVEQAGLNEIINKVFEEDTKNESR